MQPGFWEQCLDELQSNFDEQQFNTWVRPLQAVTKDKTIKITAPNQYALDWANENLTEYFIKRLENSDYSFNFEVGGISQKLEEDISNIGEDKRSSFNINKSFASDYTFDNFVTGKSNELARATAIRVSSNPGKTYNPFFIYGGVGLGKTHLLHAIASNIRENSPTKKIIYLSAERFATKFINAIRNQDITAFKNDLRSVDVLLVDDIQFMSGKISTQQEFFHTFNDLISRGCQIIISANVAPSYLENFDERIISRFSGGIVTEIKRANYELRCFVLKQKSKMLGYDLNQEIIQYLATSIDSNMRELEGALNRIIAYSSSMNGQVMDVESISQILEDLLQKSRRKITIDDIKKIVSDYFKIQMKDLNSSRRNREIARPRQIAIWLCKELTTNSLPEIGRKFNRDHTTVLHAINRVEEMISSDDKISNDILSLKRHIK